MGIQSYAAYPFSGKFGLIHGHWAYASTLANCVVSRTADFCRLRQISTAEHEEGHPMLSVLVVHKTGDMQPGDGFFELAKALVRDTSDILKAWISEVQRAYQHWNK